MFAHKTQLVQSQKYFLKLTSPQSKLI